MSDHPPAWPIYKRLLGYATPRYLHGPAAVKAAGEKLSQQTGAHAIEAGRPEETLRRALAFLGQPETGDLAQATRDWNPALIPARRARAAEP